MEEQSSVNLTLPLPSRDVYPSVGNKAEVKAAKFMNRFEYQKFKKYLSDSKHLSNLEKFNLWMWKQSMVTKRYHYLKAMQYETRGAWLRAEECLSMLWNLNEERMAHCLCESSEHCLRWRKLWNTQQVMQRIKREHLMKELLDAECQSMEFIQFMEKLDKELTCCLDRELVEVRKTSFVSLKLDQLKLEHQEISKEEELELKSIEKSKK